MRRWSAARAVAVLTVVAAVATGCAPGGASDGAGGAGAGGANTGGADTGGGAEVAGELLVFAAASLTDASEELRAAFVAMNPDVEVVFNHAGSQTLASQLETGAPADVFASADATQMERVAATRGLASDAETFATNALAIAVEAGNPAGIRSLDDLAAPDLLVVLPADEVPAGRYARQALDAAGVEVTPVSLEQDVRAALAKVELGEADAAIVYASDLAASVRADAVALPDEANVAAGYPIAVLADGPNRPAAEAYVAFVRSPEGQAILASHGFGPP